MDPVVLRGIGQRLNGRKFGLTVGRPSGICRAAISACGVNRSPGANGRLRCRSQVIRGFLTAHRQWMLPHQMFVNAVPMAWGYFLAWGYFGWLSGAFNCRGWWGWWGW
jgi:hypothetical protein